MNKYLFIYDVETSLKSLEEERVFKKGDVIATLKFSEDIHESKCEAHVVVNGTTSISAWDKAANQLSEILDSVSYVTKSSTFITKLKTILKSNKGKKNRVVFRQTHKITREGMCINDQSYASINDVLKAGDSLYPLHWLRYAYRARTVSERFIFLWLSLERYIGEEEITRKCENCGYAYSYNSISKSSVRRILIEHGYTIGEFNKLWKSRQQVFHGATRLDISFITTLKMQSDKLDRVLEGLLDEQIKPSHKIKIQIPMASEMMANDKGFYKFETSNINAEFAMDFPDDALIDLCRADSFATSSKNHGFELLDFMAEVNDW